MLNLFKKNKWNQSLSEIQSIFGLTLKDLPEPSTIEKIFKTYIQDYELSQEAATALLIRLFVLNFLGAGVIMKNANEEVDPQSYVFLLELVNVSAEYSERAKDHQKLETVTSKLNITIESLFEQIGIHRG